MYSRILVPPDGSPLAEQVIPHVVCLSRALGLRIILLRAVPSRDEGFTHLEYLQPIYDNLRRDTEASALRYLDKIKLEVSQRGNFQIETSLGRGNAAAAINAFALDLANNMVAMTTLGRSGVGRWVLGSVADRVVRHSDDPVLVVRAFGSDNE